MPQMAPINWLTLMIVFSGILIIISIINYSFKLSLPKSLFSQKIDSLKTWKW
uniref:ATP synthase complex subunit 8 n=1 Tax=Prosopocoilus laterotarsus maedaorum TaxID=618908 RepID=A0A7H1DJJ7_9SCAR|nr:ATP synthase F0 subunit 8 [Prosopocoilus laterotarsus]QNS37139.1 ATP synthase F0 subunit 8 [Prosopocoilus laterotarsus maedaorum]UTM10030.1 ATP synthase F0 subunit 8 [Prosopocoilus laterotarsus]